MIRAVFHVARREGVQDRIDRVTGVSRARVAARHTLAGETIARLPVLASAMTMEALRLRGAVPDACGPEIPVAPARGAFEVLNMVEMVPGSTERRRPAGHCGRSTMRIADAFSVMEEQARRKKGPAPFTPGQVSAGRDYAALVEQLASSGIRGISLEVAAQRGGGAGGEWIDAVVRDSRRLDGLRRRIGNGLAKEVRRVRPSARGTPKARAIRTIDLVDLVCVGGMTLAQVLERFGWNPRTTANRDALSAALAAALDRMQGYDLARPQDEG